MARKAPNSPGSCPACGVSAGAVLIPFPTQETSMLKLFEDLIDFFASILNVLDRNGDL